MSLSNLLKQLKRRFRSRKRWLTLGAVVLALGLAALLRTAAGEPASVTMAKPDSAGSRVWQEIVGGGPRIVIEQKEYLCGVETHVIGRLSPEGLERYREANPNAAVATDQEGRVIFTERIDDLSSACRNKAYFGLDKKGNLTLFDGLPEKEHVLRTFFQLNIEYLKSSLPQETLDQLYGGIKVTDAAEFNSVISTFSDYAMDYKRG